MLGRLDIDPPTVVARATESVTNSGGRRNYLRVTLEVEESGYVARLAGPQNVASLATLSRAEGLLIVPEGIERVEPGERFDVQIIRTL
jgi:molybdopterin biosynthesis enzyme